MVKAMGRHRRGSKSGGVEPATISLAVLAAIAGVAGYGSTRGELSESDQAKVEAAVAARLEIERRKNPRSAPCPDFKSERNRLLARIAEYESSEIRFRLATPDQIVKVVETVKEKVGVPKKGGADPPSDATAATNAVPPDDTAATIVPPAVVQSDATAATIVPPAVVQSDATAAPTVEPGATADPTVEPGATAAPTVEPGVTAAPALQSDGTAAPATQPATQPAEKTTEPPITADLSPEPDLEKAGVILDSIPKAFSRPRLITVLIKLESATRKSLETLRKYFDEAFAKLEPGSKTPLQDKYKTLKDALIKMREPGKKPAEQQTDRELPKLAVGPPTTLVPDATNATTTDALATNADATITTDALATNAAEVPITTHALATNAETTDALATNAETTDALATNAETTDALATNAETTDTTETDVQSEGQKEAVKEIVDVFSPPGSRATENKSAKKLGNLRDTLVTSENSLETIVPLGTNNQKILNQYNKSLKNPKGSGMRKKKLRTRRGVKQNVRRSSGRKNRSNRTHTNSR